MKLEDIKAKYAAGEITKPDFIDQMHLIHENLFNYAKFISATDVQKIEIEHGQVVMTSCEYGIKIICDEDDKRIAPIEILNFQHYEKVDSDMIFKVVGDGDRVLDIGANIGWYSLGLAKRYPGCHVKAFEPLPKTYAYLKKNVELNSLSNIEIFNHGFSNESAVLTFYYYPSGSGNASLAQLTEAEGVDKISCQVLRLDDFMGKESGGVDFIKCDVEGAELLVFQGGIETLKKHTPVVFSEMLRKWSARFNYHPNQIIDLFSALKYRCFVMREGKLVDFENMDDHTVETNFYFMHTQNHAEKIESLT